MSNIGPSYIELPETRVAVRADSRVVRRITEALLETFDRYLDAHPQTSFPDVLMAAISTFHTIVADQADRMALSPEQRESYFLTAVGALTRSLQGEIEALTTAPKPKPKPRPKPKPTKE